MKWKWIAPLALFASLSGAMHADTLNYTFTTNGAGSLDGTSFNFGLYGPLGVTFTMTADSTNVVVDGSTFSITGPETVSVAGIGTDTITDNITILDPPDQVFSLRDTTSGGGLNTYTRSECGFCYPPHNLLTGPYGPAYFDLSAVTTIFNTAHGTLVLGPAVSYLTEGSADFQITEANVASTPEPSSFILLGSGALGLLTMLRKRHRT